MANLRNQTPFGASAIPSFDQNGADILVVCVAATFSYKSHGSCILEQAEEQSSPELQDAYWGDPESSSLKVEGQTTFYRPGTDIYLTGYARPKRLTTAMIASLRVGHCEKQALVFGNRVWNKGVFGTKASDPIPFDSMPLVYERSFGGQCLDGRKPLFEPRNPVGCGLYRNSSLADGKPLPNIEDPNNPISSLRDKPSPVGFGPIARNWEPRVSFAGTYDQDWVERRAPYWPTDFDLRFFQAASTGLNSGSHLKGSEPVEMKGLSHEGPIQFSLPGLTFTTRTRFLDGKINQSMKLDALFLAPDERTATLIYRSCVHLQGGFSNHAETEISKESL